MGLRQTLKYIWASPCSALGVLVAAPLLILGASARIRAGVLEVSFASAAQPPAAALLKLPFAGITLGHVVLATTADLQDRLRPHERVHVAQYEAWGPAFLLAYPLSSLVQMFRGACPYRDNHFEVQARAADGTAWDHERDEHGSG